ncbi:uncharacterized protein LOC117649631 isoform X2 [Thrips palmi]|uniref:Uncharacterized protein LOC117649631 isoform X2 n=1 Tax=Thrips palmi TaxID=161013 RepID=A0A6P8ZT30_THRPL|nr:uncharacterized protein LOC117649631 isoform X2 [Thrips palmi]
MLNPRESQIAILIPFRPYLNCKMATSSNTESMPDLFEEMQTLAQLTGIKCPGKVMKIILQLNIMGVPPEKIRTLLRDILKAKHRSKNSSRSSNSSSDREN